LRVGTVRTLVLGGFISYSLYMTHLVWFGLWRAGMKAVGIDGGALYAVGFVVLVVGALLIAWLMWKFVEEPAREWMRTLVGARRKPTEEAGEQIQPLESAEPVIVSEDPATPGDQGTTRA
jgi:peptidoglycan/LPS O-acetylase OafA/YrhL